MYRFVFLPFLFLYCAPTYADTLAPIESAGAEISTEPRARLWRWLGQDLPLRVSIDRRVTKPVVKEIRDAMLWWNEKAGAELFTELHDLGTNGVVLILPFIGEEDWVGRAEKSGRLVAVRVLNKAANLDRIARHELGHALGLSHSSEKESVMYFQAASGKYDALEDDISLLP